MEFGKILAANAATEDAAQKAKESSDTAFNEVKTAIQERETNQTLLAIRKKQILNPERFTDIKESRLPKTEDALSEILNRIEGNTTAPKGDVVVLVVGLGEGSLAKAFLKYIDEFDDETVVIGANMFGMNGNSDTSINHHTDAKFESVLNEVAALANVQVGETCNVLQARQPFSDIFKPALRAIQNGN